MIASSEIMIRLSLATVFGAVIGLERERKDWAAGLRTHMMVCLGACLTILVSTYGFSEVLGSPQVVLDPSRIAAQVISGIGFIGAGTILFLRQRIIRGLTTASGLWTVAAIGLATGGGMYFAAFITTVLALIILWVLQPLEKRFAQRFQRHVLRITIDPTVSTIQLLQTILERYESLIRSCTVEKSGTDISLVLRFSGLEQGQLSESIGSLQSMPGVKSVESGRQ